MKKVASIAELHRLALVTGASVEMGGTVFNASRAQMTPKPAPEPEPVASVEPPVGPSEPSVTQSQLEQLMQERDAFWRAEMTRLLQTIAESIPAQQDRPSDPVAWTFTPIYSNRGERIERIDAKPGAPSQ